VFSKLGAKLKKRRMCSFWSKYTTSVNGRQVEFCGDVWGQAWGFWVTFEDGQRLNYQTLYLVLQAAMKRSWRGRQGQAEIELVLGHQGESLRPVLTVTIKAGDKTVSVTATEDDHLFGMAMPVLDGGEAGPFLDWLMENGPDEVFELLSLPEFDLHNPASWEPWLSMSREL
jgi:hypothetical protein